jgi:hypothetical protein
MDHRAVDDDYTLRADKRDMHRHQEQSHDHEIER